MCACCCARWRRVCAVSGTPLCNFLSLPPRPAPLPPPQPVRPPRGEATSGPLARGRQRERRRTSVFLLLFARRRCRSGLTQLQFLRWVCNSIRACRATNRERQTEARLPLSVLMHLTPPHPRPSAPLPLPTLDRVQCASPHLFRAHAPPRFSSVSAGVSALLSSPSLPPARWHESAVCAGDTSAERAASADVKAQTLKRAHQLAWRGHRRASSSWQVNVAPRFCFFGLILSARSHHRQRTRSLSVPWLTSLLLLAWSPSTCFLYLNVCLHVSSTVSACFLIQKVGHSAFTTCTRTCRSARPHRRTPSVLLPPDFPNCVRRHAPLSAPFCHSPPSPSPLPPLCYHCAPLQCSPSLVSLHSRSADALAPSAPRDEECVRVYVCVCLC